MLLALVLLVSLTRLRTQAKSVDITNNGQIVATVNPFELVDPCRHVRSMWSIVWACGLTLFACVWTAIHPNMPAPREHWASKSWRKMKLVVLGLIAPEYIMLLALNQRFNAKNVQKLAQSTICFELRGTHAD
jgi:hypothetical protein